MGADELSRMAAEETYKDVQNMLDNVVHKVIARFGGDYQEQRAEANLIFMEVFHSPNFDPEKAQFSSWVVTKVWYGLLERMRNNVLRSKRTIYVSEGIENTPSRPSLTFDKEEFLSHLSDDGKVAASALLSPPLDVSIAIKQRGENETPQRVRSAIKEFLKDLGWSMKRITESFSEIYKALS